MMVPIKNDFKCLLVVYSYHHNNTTKLAQVFSKVLDAAIKTPDEAAHLNLDHYDLIGFGSGIDSGKHYQQILDFVADLPKAEKMNGFIFSTSAIQGEDKVKNDHSALRNLLVSKGFIIVDEFSCKGYNTNSFLRFFGGMNKNRPNEEDLKQAEAFALSLLKPYS